MPKLLELPKTRKFQKLRLKFIEKNGLVEIVGFDNKKRFVSLDESENIVCSFVQSKIDVFSHRLRFFWHKWTGFKK